MSVFKKITSSIIGGSNRENQQNIVDDFAFQQNQMNMPNQNNYPINQFNHHHQYNSNNMQQNQFNNPQMQQGFSNPTSMYQEQLINQKNYVPMQNNNQYMETNLYNEPQVVNNSYQNPYINNPNQYQPQSQNLNYQPQNNPNLNFTNAQQGYIQPEFQNYPRKNRNPNNYYNDNMLQQPALDFDNINQIDYGNYYDPNQEYLQNQNYINQNLYQGHIQYTNHIEQQKMQNQGFNNYQANQNMYQNQYFNQAQTYYRPESYAANQMVGYQRSPANNYNGYNNNTYKQRFSKSNIIPNEIAKEIRAEKLRNALLFLIGLTGIIATSLMLAIYYKTSNQNEKWLIFSRKHTIYPFFSIFLLLISTCFFFMSVTDYTLLTSNVKKYERDLLNGREIVPYFITRNYRSIIARSVYINWIGFSTYIVGAICLGILYGLQALYKEHPDEPITIFFWKIGTMKSFESDIIVNIVVLMSVFGVHILNIITSRSRKNNIISYYGYEIIPQHEINAIRKKANKICLIIFIVVCCIILFAILIPWLVIRKKKGLSWKPWQRSKN
ncbi:MSC_0882 family membrane protein [Spiroplasma tabanidicola]|uniref:Transmembrane protein n=1 Tax=Spiroplasma tabanidicola TaxID=324079 RepID=A0A6I6C4P7_9MOLU|nr:APC family permease [Spiroplasma tabanidicola]QGS51777.1 hypothetical protein STABA_v1c04140 [Spiroplasma tabanidicola]